MFLDVDTRIIICTCLVTRTAMYQLFRPRFVPSDGYRVAFYRTSSISHPRRHATTIGPKYSTVSTA